MLSTTHILLLFGFALMVADYLFAGCIIIVVALFLEEQ